MLGKWFAAMARQTLLQSVAQKVHNSNEIKNVARATAKLQMAGSSVVKSFAASAASVLQEDLQHLKTKLQDSSTSESPSKKVEGQEASKDNPPDSSTRRPPN